MAFVDCRKIVKQDDVLKIRWLDATGLTVNCNIYDPNMNKKTVDMVENPSSSGIYEVSYTFSAGNGDYLFIVNGEGLQVSSIAEITTINDIKTNTDLIPDIKTNTDLITNVKTNTDLIPEIKNKTDKLQFSENDKILAEIDDNGLAKYDVQKRQTVEMDRIRLQSRRRK